MAFLPNPGLALLASWRASASFTTSPAISFPACEVLQVSYNIVGYGGSGGIASFIFNSDTGTRYSSSYITYSTAAPAAPTNNLSQTLFRLGANSVTVQRSGFVTIFNFLSTNHVITSQSATFATVANAPVSSVGSGVYQPASSNQVTSITLTTPEGVSMPAGTSFAVFGLNP